MSSKEFAFVFVGGAWHIPAHYQPFLDIVAARGYRIVAPRLPSTQQTIFEPLEADAKAVADVVRELVDEGLEIVVIGHSMGGISGAQGAHGLGVRERKANGLKGGVRSLVLVASIGEPPGKQLTWDPDSLASKAEELFIMDVRRCKLIPRVAAGEIDRILTVTVGRLHCPANGAGPRRGLLPRRSRGAASGADGHADEEPSPDGAVCLEEPGLCRGEYRVCVLRAGCGGEDAGSEAGRRGAEGSGIRDQGDDSAVGPLPIFEHAREVSGCDLGGCLTVLRTVINLQE